MIKCNRKKIFVKLRRSVGLILILMLFAGSLEVAFMPVKAFAGTTQRQGNKIVNTTTSETLTYGGYSHESTVYAGEIKRNGETVLNYLFSEDITRSSVVFDNLRKALPNPYSDMVPSVIEEQTQKGLKEMSASTVNNVNLSSLSADWKEAGNIASQIYKGKNTSDAKNELMYDASEECRSGIDGLAHDRVENLDNPVETNKRVISHLGTQSIDTVSFQVEEGQLIEIHDVNLIYLSEATTLIYTTVNVVDKTASEEKAGEDEPEPEPEPEPKPEPKPASKPKKESKSDSDSSDHSLPPNPNALTIIYKENGVAVVNARAAKQVQGPTAQLAFRQLMAQGCNEAFTFNLLVDGKTLDYKLKNGKLTLFIPDAYKKNGRIFALLVLDKNGKVHFCPDTDNSPLTVTVDLLVEGYAFDLIYVG